MQRIRRNTSRHSLLVAAFQCRRTRVSQTHSDLTSSVYSSADGKSWGLYTHCSSLHPPPPQKQRHQVNVYPSLLLFSETFSLFILVWLCESPTGHPFISHLAQLCLERGIVLVVMSLIYKSGILMEFHCTTLDYRFLSLQFPVFCSITLILAFGVKSEALKSKG